MAQNKPWNRGKKKARVVAEFVRDELAKLELIGHAEEEAGRKPGYLKNKLGRGRDGDLLVSEFLVFADVARRTPAGLLQAAGVSPTGDLPGLDADDDLPRLLSDIPEPDEEPFILEHVDSGSGRATSERELKEVDALRYTDPATAYHELLKLKPEPEHFHRVFAIASSCFRMADLHHESSRLLFEAWIWSKQEDHTARGDVYQRATYLLMNLGYGRRALEAALKATGQHSLTGDRKRIGETIIDRAYCFGASSQLKRAERTYRAALNYDDILDQRNRLALRQGLGLVLIRQGKVEEAKVEASSALDLFSSSDRTTTGKLNWLLASIAATERSPEAEGLYLTAIDMLQETPVEALICSAEAARFFSKVGNKFGLGELISRISNLRSVDREIPALGESVEDLTHSLRTAKVETFSGKVSFVIDQQKQRRRASLRLCLID